MKFRHSIYFKVWLGFLLSIFVLSCLRLLGIALFSKMTSEVKVQYHCILVMLDTKQRLNVVKKFAVQKLSTGMRFLFITKWWLKTNLLRLLLKRPQKVFIELLFIIYGVRKGYMCSVNFISFQNIAPGVTLFDIWCRDLQLFTTIYLWARRCLVVLVGRPFS